MIKVFIVDDHEIIRDGLNKILNEETDFVVVGEARNGDEVLRNIQNVDCDIILLDLNMPGRCGLDLIADLKKLRKYMYILVLSIYPEDKFTLRLLKAGASGYVCKAVALQELVHAIRKVCLTGRYMSVTLAEQLAIDFIPGNREKLLHESLSSLDMKIMFLLASGRKVKDIAVDLKLSVSSVFSHRMYIHKKLNVENDVELLHYVNINKLSD